MKQGKKLTRKQKEELSSSGYDCTEWLLERKTDVSYTFIHRQNKETITIALGRLETK